MNQVEVRDAILKINIKNGGRMKSKIVLAVLFLFLPAISYGQLITISISGYVLGINDEYSNLENQIHAGDIITGTYTFDTTISGLSYYNYYASPAGISLDVGSVHFQTDPANVRITFGVDNNRFGEDWYTIYSHNNLSLPNGVPVTDIVFELNDPSGTALSSDAFPLTVPDLSKWSSSLKIEIARGGTRTIMGTITSATLIPEPCSILLLLAGGFVFRIQKQKKGKISNHKGK